VQRVRFNPAGIPVSRRGSLVVIRIGKIRIPDLFVVHLLQLLNRYRGILTGHHRTREQDRRREQNEYHFVFHLSVINGDSMIRLFFKNFRKLAMLAESRLKIKVFRGGYGNK